jgi:hypothetical protein
MKKFFDVLLNKVFKHQLELLYGTGASVKINNVIYSTNSKSYVLDCTLTIGDIQDYNDEDLLIQEGINYLVTESWVYSGYRDKEISILLTINNE